jgi:hypothetical protein
MVILSKEHVGTQTAKQKHNENTIKRWRGKDKMLKRKPIYNNSKLEFEMLLVLFTMIFCPREKKEVFKLNDVDMLVRIWLFLRLFVYLEVMHSMKQC